MPIQIQKRTRANRQNAQKSTGPRTPEGKAKSSMNALKHGLLAESVVVPNCSELESQEQFDELLSDLATEYSPKGPIEKLLVETIAISYWRLRRALRYEAAEIVGRVKHHQRWYSGDPIGRISLPTIEKTHMILRYETIIERRLNRATTRLEQLQNKRRSKNHRVAPSNSPVARLSGGFPSQRVAPSNSFGGDSQPCGRDVRPGFNTQPDASRQKPNEPNPSQPNAPYSDTPVYPFPKTTPAGYPSFQPYKLPEKKMRP